MAVLGALTALAFLATPRAVFAAAPPDDDGPSATPASVDFRWDAPVEGCPSEAAVQAELERLLGGSLDEMEARRLTVIARVRAEDDGTWDARLWTVTPEETRYREIRDASCALVADASALIAAMIIDPAALAAADAEVKTAADSAESASVEVDAAPEETREESQASAESSEVEPEPAPAPEPVQPTSVSEPEPRTRRLRASVQANGGIAFDGRPALGPHVGLGFALGVGAGLGEFELAVGPPSETSLDEGFPGASLTVTQVHGALRGCYDLRKHPRVAFTGCGGVEFGALVGRSAGIPDARTDAVPWLALSVRPTLGVRLVSALWLELTPELAVPLARTSFEVSGLGVVYEPRAVGGRVLLGLRWWWGPKSRGGATDPGAAGNKPQEPPRRYP